MLYFYYFYAYRASAYDVYAPGVMQTAQRAAAPEERGPSPVGPRRASFRVAPDDTPGPQKDSSPSPDGGMAPSLFVDEDRRTRRRGSQLYVYKYFIVLPRYYF